MKNILAVAALLVCVCTPALAEDAVPQSTLADLGLAGMEVVSDAEGMQVRGEGSSASAFGFSLVAGLAFGGGVPTLLADFRSSRATAENAGLNETSLVVRGGAPASITFDGFSLAPFFLGGIRATAGGPGLNIFGAFGR